MDKPETMHKPEIKLDFDWDITPANPSTTDEEMPAPETSESLSDILRTGVDPREPLVNHQLLENEMSFDDVMAQPTKTGLAYPLGGKGDMFNITATTGYGKTTMLVRMALDMIRGLPTFGIYPMERPVSVALMCAESGSELGDLVRSVGAELIDSEKQLISFYATVPDLNDFVGPESLPAYLAAWKERELSGGKPAPQIVVADPLGFSLSAAQMNNNAEMNRIWTSIKKYVVKYGIIFGATHHPNKSEKDKLKPGGAGQTKNYLTSQWGLDYKEQKNSGVITCEKLRARLIPAGEPIPSLGYRIASTELGPKTEWLGPAIEAESGKKKLFCQAHIEKYFDDVFDGTSHTLRQIQVGIKADGSGHVKTTVQAAIAKLIEENRLTENGKDGSEILYRRV